MKSSKLEPFYLFLSLILLGFSGFVYLTYGRQIGTASTSITPTVTVETSASSQEDAGEDLTDITNRVNEAAKNPSQVSIDSLTAEVNAFTDSDKKDLLLQTLADMTLDLATIEAVEENLLLAETTGIADYFTAAQENINELKAETKKTELQERLNQSYLNLTGVAWSAQ